MVLALRLFLIIALCVYLRSYVCEEFDISRSQNECLMNNSEIVLTGKKNKHSTR